MMFLIRSLASYYRSQRLLNHPATGSHGVTTRHVQGAGAMDRRRFCSGTDERVGLRSATETRDGDVAAGVSSLSKQPPPPSPFSTWLKWVFGSMLAIMLPFWQRKWVALLRLEGEVEVFADVVEEAADVLEKVATVAEKVTAEVAEELPENGKLKHAVLVVEHVSHEAAEDAHLAKDIIHKVDEVKQEVGILLESVTHIKVDDIKGNMEKH